MMIKIIQQDAWHQLQSHATHIKQQRLSYRFVEETDRFVRYSVKDCGLLMDYSKHYCNAQTWTLLRKLLTAVHFEKARMDLFEGEAINTTENRAAWHTALRASDKMPQVQSVLEQMQLLVDRLWHQLWRGYRGQPITDVVNIGIGGSDLGPLMACRALPNQGPLRCHFISNLDPEPLEQLLKLLNPETTLFVVISKSFATLETLTNAKRAKHWLEDNGCSTDGLRQHFLAITAQPEKAIEFGVHANDILPMWDWVGGRFSLWSAVGLCIALHTGMPGFLSMLEGALAMDQHFLTAEPKQNMPIILGLLAVWYQNFLFADTHAVIPYLEALEYLPNYLQQLHMESLGKRVTKLGEELDYQTGQIIWGSTGTNSQHAYHQQLLQGTKLIPIDFIVEKNLQKPALFANCLAQAEVLMNGFEGKTSAQTIPGNQPSTLLVIDQLTPHSLGALLALYEHKVFVQSVIWQINAFDQFGVERGKQMANQITQSLLNDSGRGLYDSSTQGLINYYLQQEMMNV